MSQLLTVSVMAHPTRGNYFPYLRERLGDVPFAIDRRSEGVWANCRKAWKLGLRMKTDAPYHCVIQDDALVCRDFYRRAESVLAQVKGQEREFKRKWMKDELVVNFYFGRRPALLRIGRQSMKRGYWLWHNVCWGVALCLRREWIAEMIDFCDRIEGVPQDDERITRYLRSKGRHTYFPVPCLVNHRTGQECPSLIGDPGLDRSAFAWVDDVRGTT